MVRTPRKSFYRGDSFSPRVLGQRNAGRHGPAINVHNARATLTMSAPELRSLQARPITQQPEQRLLCFDRRDLDALAVHCEHGRARIALARVARVFR
jgi:hypothetical protein